MRRAFMIVTPEGDPFCFQLSLDAEYLKKMVAAAWPDRNWKTCEAEGFKCVEIEYRILNDVNLVRTTTMLRGAGQPR